MTYGEKRDYPKIDIYAFDYVEGKRHRLGHYLASTTWAKSCFEAVLHYCLKDPKYKVHDLYAYYSSEL